jgi:hypothetical protein
LRHATGIVAVGLVDDLHLENGTHMPRLDTDHRQARLSESAVKPLRQWSSFQSNPLEVIGIVLQHLQQSSWFARDLDLANDPARVIHNADARFLD